MSFFRKPGGDGAALPPQPASRASQAYVLGHADRELERLAAQARLIGPITRRILIEAGIAPGMGVLDVGSGGGDVSLLLAELVGPGGAVVGADGAEIGAWTRTAGAR